MAEHCYICNKQDGGVEKTKINIFETKTPMSGSKIFELLLEISGKDVPQECKEKNNLCAKCYKSLLEYDYLLARLNEMKTSIRENIHKSEQLRNIKKELIVDDAKAKEKSNIKLVLPASKLQPLPPGFDLRVQTSTSWSNVSTTNVPKSMPSISSLPNLTETTDASETTSTIKTEMDINQLSSIPRVIIERETIATLLNKGNFTLNGIAKGYVRVTNEQKDEENPEEKPMEIDEDAVVIASENGPIIGVVSGQKFIYGDNEISLVVPHDNDSLDNNDDQDSNSESHIELQMSGDEETANAIIAAANEQGAFIKVDSGEMYEVKSVESKIGDSSPSSEMPIQMVEQEGDKFKCLLCEKSAKADSEPELLDDAVATMKHLKSVHGARLYICQCGVMLRRRADYVQHIEQHAEKSNQIVQPADKSKTHECNVCKKKFSSRLLLNEHTNTHTGKRPYTCEICNKSFASRYTQQSHLKTHLERPRPFKCNQCGKSFFTQHNLHHHEKIHSATKDFVCNVCGKAFGTQHNLEVHGVVHSGKKPFVCTVCEKAFARRAEVRDHMRIHTGERPFECETCGARFSQRSNLHSHRRATHLDDKRHQCTHCPKRFKRRRLLDYHIKSSHTGERPLKCEVCAATFVYPEHYKKHIRIHSGEKPYICEVCGKGFNSRDNRNMHRFVHSDRKPYECVACGAGFMRRHLLTHHMHTAGHVSESIVINQPRISKLEDNEIKTQSVIVRDKKKDDKLMETIYESADVLELDSAEKVVELEGEDNITKYVISTDKKFMMSDGKSLNLVPEVEGEETALLTIQQLEGIEKIEGTVLENITAEQLEQAHILSDGNNTVRLIQIQLADGNSGWVAVSQ
ncbi:GDNF-inducible zinc finger protein 1-like [Colias croceus]|uniref:GDNF-inducible zinc finger protein 1-like n=1 Tax=Colias crocea TaxID=72248 RepID=UPI001E27DA76|nr:GDNF-inducible zinc finger protein 1-like [Colias croceus]XP_045507944.1 GDNF-inducible zinc finger protein 1-like [Colias croceus]